MNDEPLTRLRDHIAELVSHSSFRHRTWYVRYHLALVEQIAIELSSYHPQANRTTLVTLSWIHDLGKIIGASDQHNATATECVPLLRGLGFAEHDIDETVSAVRMMNRCTDLDLRRSPIEVQIVSSADGCAHFIGPFMQLWLWENPDEPFESLLASNLRKLEKDWTRKIVLPEARAALEARYHFLREQNGVLPQLIIKQPA